MSISLNIIPPRGFDVYNDLVLSPLLFELGSDCRKTIKGWARLEKVVEAKLSIEYIKNNL